MKNEVFALIYLATLPPSMNKQSNNTQKINADFNLKMHDVRSMQCECTGNRSSRKLLLKECFHVAFHEKELSQSLDNLLSKNRKTKYCFFFRFNFYFFVSFFFFFFFHLLCGIIFLLPHVIFCSMLLLGLTNIAYKDSKKIDTKLVHCHEKC